MIDTLKDKKILVICESPNKTAHIKEYLKKAGYNINVVASIGHIMELANGGTYYNSGIEPTNNFELNLQVSEDKHKVVEQLKIQAKQADLVYLMSDPDREGEVISWSLVKFLKLPKNKIRRAVTHEITPKAVVKAIENPIDINDALVDAGLARLTLDKMLGFVASPIAKRYIGARSVGRCQSVGLKLVVDREKEIQNFKPETYFDVYLHFKKNGTEFKAKYAGNETVGNIDHLTTQAAVDQLKANCKKDYLIEDIKSRVKEESPKPPFCTATFQQEASSKLGLKVKDAMTIAQKLFEAGAITYMRTDDTEFAAEFIPTLQSYIENNYGKASWTTPRVGKKQENAQEGHECLRITNPELTPEVFAAKDSSQLNQKVYKLIWQRTVASALPNAKIAETQYLIDNTGEKFILISNEIQDLGYRKVYSYQDEDSKEEGPVKETFKKGEKLQDTSLEDVKKQTKPKPRFSEATLIKELQKNGCGRPSTYATIVETVLSASRGYAELKDKAIVPTDRGIQLVEFLDRNFSNVINLNYTKDMEADLDKIAEGKMKKLDFLNNFYNNLENTIKNNKELIGQSDEDAPICPKCGAKMVLRRSKYGKNFYGCSNYPKCNGLLNVK